MEAALAVSRGVAKVSPEPAIPELNEQQTKAAVYRGAVRVLSGGVPEPLDELETRLLVALEAALFARRAQEAGLPHVAREFARCCVLPPLALIQIERMVNLVIAAAPPPPPLPVTKKR